MTESDPSGRLGPRTGLGLTIRQIKSVMANQEFSDIRRRTMAGKSRRLGEGKYARGGKPPYGYMQIVAGKQGGWDLAPDPEAAPRLKQVLAWYCAGGVTHAARKATEAGFPTPMSETDNRKGKAADWTPTRWSPVSVQHMVRNVAVYLGETKLVFAGQEHTLKYPSLIDSRTYAEVEKRTREKTLKHRATFLTTGFVDCSCGAHLHQRNSHDKHYARCSMGCGSMRQEQFEAVLWNVVVCRLVQIQKHERTIMGGVDPYGPSLDAAKGRLQAVQEEAAKLLDVYLAGDLDKTLWRAKNEILNSRLALARSEVDRVTREQTDHEKRRATEQTVEARVGAILEEMAKRRPTLERRRSILRDLLPQSERVIASWPQRKNRDELSPWASITLPKFGELPPVTVRTDEDIQTKMLGGEVQGIHVSSHVGIDPHKTERDLVAKIQNQGMKVVSQTVNEEGDIEVVYDTGDGDIVIP